MTMCLTESLHVMQGPAMTLAEYLEQHGERAAAFAARTGLSPSQVSRLVRGKSRPSWKTIATIDAATGARVTAADWAAVDNAA